MIAAIVPVHNEEAVLAECLRSLQGAAADAALAGEEVRIFAVLDDCLDASGAIAADWFSLQLAHSADVVSGTVKVENWLDHPLSSATGWRQLTIPATVTAIFTARISG